MGRNVRGFYRVKVFFFLEAYHDATGSLIGNTSRARRTYRTIASGSTEIFSVGSQGCGAPPKPPRHQVARGTRGGDEAAAKSCESPHFRMRPPLRRVLWDTMQVAILPASEPSLCAPLTSNRGLGECLIANLPMRQLLTMELTRAGFEVIPIDEIEPRTIRLPIDCWLEVGALIMLGRETEPACLLGPDNSVLAWKGADSAGECVKQLVTEAVAFPIRYPWDILRLNEQVLAMSDETSLLGEVHPSATISGAVRIGNGAVILPGTVIEGPVLIGPNCRIGPNAYIRGATSIGADCRVGNGAEVKNSIIGNHSYVSRQCYVGDSIIGSHVNLGAGTCIENHRRDGHFHISIVNGRPVDTRRTKLGAIIADGVKIGVNCSIEAGVKIGIARTVKPGTYVADDML